MTSRQREIATGSALALAGVAWMLVTVFVMGGWDEGGIIGTFVFCAGLIPLVVGALLIYDGNRGSQK
jgi:peptidoglycan/LPS O-acetylase OafA/YrhL